MAAEVNVIVNAVDNFSTVLGNFGNIVTGIKSAIDLVSDAFNAASDAISPFVESAAESEVAFTRLETVFNSTNGAVGLTIDQLTDLASVLQDSTRFSDEDIMGAEAMLLRFENLSSDIFPEVLSLSTDLAESLGIDLSSAARMLGVAFDNPVEGIGRLNMQFRIFNDAELENIRTMAEHGQVAEAQALIMERLTEKFGGAAAAIGDTFTGKLEILTNKLDDFRELIGGPIIYLLGQLLDKIMEFADTNPVIQGVIRFFTEFNTLLQTPDVPFLSALGVALLHIQDSGVLNDLGGVLLALQGNINQGMDPFTAIALGLETLADKWEGTAAGGIVERILEFVNTTQTEGLGPALGDLFRDAWDGLMNYVNGGEFRADVQTLIDTLSDIIGDSDFTSIARTFADIFNDALTLALQGLDEIVTGTDWTPLGNALRGAMSEIWTGFSQSDQNSEGTAAANQLFTDIFGNVDWNTLGYNTALNFIAPFTNWALIIINQGARLGQIGAAMIEGIAEGIRLNAILLEARFLTALAKLIIDVKAFLGIASPSTMFFGIGWDVIQGLWDGMKGNWANLAAWLVQKLQGVLTVLAGNDTGGTTGGIPGDTTHPRDPGTGTTTGGMLGGVVNNFYGPVYVGTMEELYCPSPHPLMTASSQSLLTSSIG